MFGVGQARTGPFRAAIFLSLLFAVTIFWFFLNNRLEVKKSEISRLESAFTRADAQEKENAAFFARMLRLTEERAGKRVPFENEKEAFSELTLLLEHAGLGVSHVRKGDAHENVCFEISGKAAFPALLAFFDSLFASGRPCGVLECTLESAADGELDYRILLQVLILAGENE